MVNCPNCASNVVTKRGKEFRNGEVNQRWKCTPCRANFYTDDSPIHKISNDTLTSSTDLKDGDSQVRPFMPERDAYEKHLTSTLSSQEARPEKVSSNNSPNVDNYTTYNDHIQRASLYPPPEGSGFTDSLVTGNSGWSKIHAANDEAKIGNIPEIGLKENLQGLEVTGVTYLKKDENNVLHWVKTKARAKSQDMYEEVIARMLDRVPVAELITPPQKTDCSLLNQYVITDAHFGMRAWGEETGGDNWDLPTAYDTYTKAIDIAIHRAPDAEIGLFVQGGDMAHFDGINAVTPTSGHILEADGRFLKMYDVCIDVHLETIDKLLLKHDRVKVIIAQGNHDLSTSDTFRSLVRRYYSKNERVEVVGYAQPYYVVTHGVCFLAWHHGHLKKKMQLPSYFAQNFSKMWGDTTHRYIGVGHLHSLNIVESGGAITTQYPTLSAADAYGAHKFCKTLRSISTTTYSDKYGEISKNTIPIEMVYLNR